MKKVTLSLMGGAVIGSLATWLLAPTELTQTMPSKTLNSVLEQVEIEEETAVISIDHSSRLSSYRTIDDILRLPSDFQQTEALYVLAGRVSPRELIGLIKQAEMVTDASDRSYALSILFARLTEISPDLAIEAAGDTSFVADENIIRVIWRTWARLDFNAALKSANELSPQNRKQAATNAMYWALGVFGNEKTDQIKAVTGIEPSLWAVSQTIEKVAKNSISEAIGLVNQLPLAKQQVYVARDLAVFSAKSQPEYALSYEDYFRSAAAAKAYRSAVLKTTAEQSPELVLQSWRASGSAKVSSDSIYAALAQIAYEDFERAIEYAQEAIDPTVKAHMLKVVLAVKARESATDAVSLAHEYQLQGHAGMLGYVVQNVLNASPSDALLALESLPRTAEVKRLLAMSIGRLSENDPVAAISKIESLGDPKLREDATAQLVLSWSRSDVDAALSYALTLEKLTPAGIRLDSADLDLAMQFIEKFEYVNDGGSIYGFTNGLVSRYGINELMSKLRPYENNQSFSVVKGVLLNQISNESINDAERFIDAFWSENERGSAFTSLVQNAIYLDPKKAISILDKVDSPNDKALMVSSIMSTWAYKDKSGARSWVQGLPKGVVRDNAIVAYSHQLKPESDKDVRLINSIENNELREEAVLGMLVDRLGEGADQVAEWGAMFDLNDDSMTYLASISECYNVDVNQPVLLRRCRSLFSSRF